MYIIHTLVWMGIRVLFALNGVKPDLVHPESLLPEQEAALSNPWEISAAQMNSLHVAAAIVDIFIFIVYLDIKHTDAHRSDINSFFLDCFVVVENRWINSQINYCIFFPVSLMNLRHTTDHLFCLRVFFLFHSIKTWLNRSITVNDLILLLRVHSQKKTCRTYSICHCRIFN